MKDFNGNVKDASVGFNRSVANIGEGVERETAKLAACPNNEVVPAIRGRSSKALQVTAAAGPGENDQVIDAAGAHVYLEPQAAAYLEDKVLDAQVDSEGQAHFSLGVQGPG